MFLCVSLCTCVYLIYLYVPVLPILYVPVLTDAVAGHDTRDSTTVTDSMETFTLPDDICVKHLHIGIPKVHILSLSSLTSYDTKYARAIYSIMCFIIDSKGVENV